MSNETKALSISFRSDDGCIEHNNRDFFTDNVDKSRTPNNITYGNTAQRPFIGFCACLACIFSVILHNSSLQGDSLAASSLYNLTKNLTAQYTHNLCAVLPYVKRDLRELYHELFDEALVEYNARQNRPDRQIPDYYEHIRKSKK